MNEYTAQFYRCERPGLRIICRCRKCSNAVEVVCGGLMMGIQIQDREKTTYHFLGVPSEKICCEGQKLVPRFFTNDVEFNQEVQRLHTMIVENRSTEGIHLLSFILPGLDTGSRHQLN